MTHDEIVELAKKYMDGKVETLGQWQTLAICGALIDTSGALKELGIAYKTVAAERDALKGHAEVGALVVSLSRRVMTWLNSDDEKATKGEAWELGETVIASRLYDILYNAGAEAYK